jgi:hypothetical protein
MYKLKSELTVQIEQQAVHGTDKITEMLGEITMMLEQKNVESKIE